ncbi:uncharacterized protein LOC132039641 isoform X1 [Lycium ferocissimum]|uniref:uncharacterized protein LOC132039641 isoform X1 n=1 Tax=Lycium ferocissimum TaxID=112874 RepID=UPI002815EC27|nr:uncharacterized protein LOC132039641 isoform X1 [Lycium ferocissimum]
MALSGQIVWQSLSSTPDFRSRQSIPLLKTPNAKITKLNEQKLKIGSIRSRQRSLIARSMVSPEIGKRSLSPSNTIETFYASINNKDLNQLSLLISEDCFFDDFSFPQSFQGRKEALKFLEQLTTSMGQNTELSIDNIYEGVDLTAIVNWHLEWKRKEVPFTRGCSYYELSRDGEQILIKNAQVITESSMKPKILALFNMVAAMKLPGSKKDMVTSIYDNLPETAARFVNNDQVKYQLLLNTFKVVLQPYISSILAWYKKLWTFIVTFVGLINKLVQSIIKKIREQN